MIDNTIDLLIAKVLQNSADEQEKDIFNDWLSASRENQKIFESLKLVWENNKTPVKAVAQDELVDKIWETAKKNAKPEKKQNRRSSLRFLKVAASIAFLTSMYFFFEKDTPTVEHEEFSYEEVAKRNGSGQKSMIHLVDGTLVWLNAESTLIYKKPFGADLREVELVGEAYFEVAKDSTKPFIVHFNGSKIKVLGTSFNISSYHDDKTDVISLAEGKIELTHGTKSQILNAGWITEIDPKTNQLKSYEGKVEENISWINGIILFRGASYKEVFSKLERWYGVKIETTGTPGPGLKFNGSFKNETLENVLENLVLEDNLSFKIDKENVHVMFN